MPARGANKHDVRPRKLLEKTECLHMRGREEERGEERRAESRKEAQGNLPQKEREREERGEERRGEERRAERPPDGAKPQLARFIRVRLLIVWI